jgi:predicted dinucleotide-binding enzyme
MRIAIVGAGHVGQVLAAGLSRSNHDVTIASHTPDDAAKVAHALGVGFAPTLGEAADGAGVIILAVPASARADVAQQLGNTVSGRTIMDVTNVRNEEMTGVASERSGAQDLQDMMTGSHVVKALNTVMAVHMANPVIDGVQLDGLYAGDDEDAKTAVRTLIEDLGFRPIDAGPLPVARALEEMGVLNVRLNATNGWKWQTAWKLLGPTE